MLTQASRFIGDDGPNAGPMRISILIEKTPPPQYGPAVKVSASTTAAFVLETGTTMTWDWGDGTIQTGLTAPPAAHEYGLWGLTPNYFVITITGRFVSIGNNATYNWSTGFTCGRLISGTYCRISHVVMTELEICDTLKTFGFVDPSPGGYNHDDAIGVATAPKSCNLPDSVETIGLGAFRNASSITDFKFPASLKSLQASAFRMCTMLTEIDLPDGLETIGNYCFQNCWSATRIRIPGSVTSFGYCAFNGLTALQNIDLTESEYAIAPVAGKSLAVLDEWYTEVFGSPYYIYTLATSGSGYGGMERVSTLESGCFTPVADHCEAVIPSNIKTIGQSTFTGSGVTKITMDMRGAVIPESWGSLYVSDYAFSLCHFLEKFTLYNWEVVQLGQEMLYYCESLKSVVMECEEDGFSDDPSYCFNYCENLEYVRYRCRTLTYLPYNHPFFNCTGLKSFILDFDDIDLEQVGEHLNSFSVVDHLFGDEEISVIPSDFCIYVPAAYVSLFKSVPGINDQIDGRVYPLEMAPPDPVP